MIDFIKGMFSSDSERDIDIKDVDRSICNANEMIDKFNKFIGSKSLTVPGMNGDPFIGCTLSTTEKRSLLVSLVLLRKTSLIMHVHLLERMKKCKKYLDMQEGLQVVNKKEVLTSMLDDLEKDARNLKNHHNNLACVLNFVETLQEWSQKSKACHRVSEELLLKSGNYEKNI